MIKSCINILVVFVIALQIYNCNKYKDEVSPKNVVSLSIEDNLFIKIDSFINSKNCKKEKVIEIRYQKYKDKEYIQISTEKTFITDSLFILKNYNNYLLAFYNEEFFNKFLNKNDQERDSIVNVNIEWNLASSNKFYTGYPCFDMYEKRDNDLIKVKTDTYEYNNLFLEPPMFDAPELHPSSKP